MTFQLSCSFSMEKAALAGLVDGSFPAAKPVAIGGMTKEQIDMELQKGMDDIAAGRVVSADEVDAEMRRLYGI